MVPQVRAGWGRSAREDQVKLPDACPTMGYENLGKANWERCWADADDENWMIINRCQESVNDEFGLCKIHRDEILGG